MSDRKYRQKGYQDGDSEPDQSRRKASRPAKDGPRGRGLGAPTRTVFRCRDCGEIAADAEPACDSACRKCGAALHSCVNCAHFDPGSRYECRQPIEARLVSKTKANSCRHFSAKLVAELGEQSSEPSDPRAAFDALFK